MTTSFPKEIDLLRQAQERQLYGRLVEQLRKDFAMANVSISFSGRDHDALPSPGDLCVALHEKLYVLILERFSDYLNLLYIIDVPETALRRLPTMDVVGLAKQVVFLVLEREMQKVWWKWSQE